MNGHPWHPVIVHFPLACWVLATLVDVASRLFSMPLLPGIEWAAVAHLLLWTGIVMAVPAMIAGLVDYARLPPKVQESSELSWHITAMGTAWALFLGAAIWRVRAAPFDGVASWGVIFLELAGSACLVVGGRLASVIVFDRLPSARTPAPVLRDGQAEFDAAAKKD